MKRLFSLLVGGIVLCTLAARLVPREARCAAEPGARTAILGVEGMTCSACSTSVWVVLKKLDGVADAKVSLDEKKAVVTYDPAKVTPEKMVEAIQARLPYKAKVLEPGKGKQGEQRE